MRIKCVLLQLNLKKVFHKYSQKEKIECKVS